MKPHKHLRNGNSTQYYQHHRHCLDSDRKDQSKSLRHLNKSQNSLRKSAPLRDRSASRNSKNSSPNHTTARRECHSKPPISRQPNFSALSSFNNHESHKDVKDVTKAGQNNLQYAESYRGNDIDSRPQKVTFYDDTP